MEYTNLATWKGKNRSFPEFTNGLSTSCKSSGLLKSNLRKPASTCLTGLVLPGYIQERIISI